MELTPKQDQELRAARQELRAALMSAFPSQPRLELMVEDELGEELNQITQDQSDYELVVRDLVKWAETNGKLRDLVVSARRKNPGNPQLKSFFQKHVLMLLGVEASPLSSELLESLIQRLESIDDFSGVVLPSCTQTLPDLDIHRLDLKEKLLSDELSDAKWLILLGLFLKDWERDAEGQLNIVKFVQNLQQHTPNATKSALTEWLSYLPTDLQPTPTEPELDIHPSRLSDETLKTLQSHFLITVAANPIKDQDWWVNGYLITRLGEDDQLTKFCTLTLQPLPDDDSTKSREARAESLCLKFSSSAEALRQIEHCLPDWLVQVQGDLGNQCINLQKSYKLAFLPIYDLTVEFWLPFEHLTAAADTWKVYSKPVRLRKCNLFVGKEYRVVVRSYDRFSDPDALNTLNRTWQTLSKGSVNTADLQKTHHLDCWTRWADLQRQMQEACLGLSITCPLSVQEHESQREELFAWILEKGIPMALWSRCSDLTDTQKATLKGKMQALLSADILSQIDQFLEQIKQARKAAEADQLALWCDEPKRLTELKQFLEPGRLSA